MDWKAIQRALLRAGFNPGPLDGVRGPRTNAALARFRASVGLSPTPLADADTIELLTGQPEPETHVPWLAEAYRVMGLHERRNTSALRGWFSRSVDWIDPRDIPWCGAFVETCYRQWNPDIVTPDNPLGARNWQGFGLSVPPALGALLVFWRGSRGSWKGHVGFYHGEDRTHYHVVGGNQSDAVTISRISKARLLSARWPDGFPYTTDPIWLDPKGIPVTTNEA